MADISFYHGTRVFESNETPVLIRTAQSAVVALIGTAPDADPEVFPANRPVLIRGPHDYNVKVRKLGAAGTLKDAVDGVFDQTGTYCYIIRVPEGASHQETISNIVGAREMSTGVHALNLCEPLFGNKLKPRLVCVPGLTGGTASDGIASVSMNNTGGDYYTDNVTARIEGDGVGAELGVLLVDSQIKSIYVKKPGYGYTTAEVVIEDETGEGAAATAHVGQTASPVVAELYSILEANRAVAFVDGPDTTDEEAILYRQMISSQRIYICDSTVLVRDQTLNVNLPRPASPRFAGVQAKVDRTLGFHNSVSNKPISGIVGMTRPVMYGTHVNYLNQSGVNTVINDGDGGFLTYGNRCATSDDLWQFLSVRRIADFANEAIEAAYREFVDKPFSKANLKFMVESGKAFLKLLEAEGYIVPGSSDVWLDGQRNVATEMVQGRVTLGIKFEPVAPMEDIRIIAHRNIISYELMLDEVVRELNDGVFAVAA